MTAGSLLAGASLLIVATAQNPAWFLGGWLLAGASMGAVLYPPAFAALTRWYGPRRVGALTALTLTAGLASTVFAPLTAALAAVLDWRGSYLVLAAVLLVVTVPAHWWGLRLPWPRRPDDDTQSLVEPADTARSRAFVALTAALSVAAFAAVAAVVNLIPLLTERGLSAGTAAIALGLGGAGQVIGRLFYSGLTRRTGVRVRTVLTLAGVAVTTALLGVLTTVAALVAAAVVAGAARGLFTLVQATAVTDRWGARHYGRLTGLLSAPLTTATALAPWAGAALADLLGSYSAMYLLLAALGVVAAVVGMAGTPRSPQPTTKGRPA